jgi:hypothetical protein
MCAVLALQILSETVAQYGGTLFASPNVFSKGLLSFFGLFHRPVF